MASKKHEAKRRTSRQTQRAEQETKHKTKPRGERKLVPGEVTRPTQVKKMIEGGSKMRMKTTTVFGRHVKKKGSRRHSKQRERKDENEKRAVFQRKSDGKRNPDKRRKVRRYHRLK